MNELKNPFAPGAGTTPPILKGRDGLIQDFVIALERAKAGRPSQCLIPIGLRGVGKTVLLNRFVEEAETRGVLARFIEAPEQADLREILARELRQLLLQLDRMGAVSEKVKRALRVLKGFTLSAGPDGGLSFTVNVDPEPGAADSGNLSADLTELFLATGEAARDRGTAVLLAIDEMQHLGEETFAALITALHRSTQKQLPLVLTGAGLPQLPGQAGLAKSYAERLFSFPVIGALDCATEARGAVQQPIEAQGLRIDPGALDLLVEQTQGYPYFLQEWGYAVWNAAERSPITRADVERAAAVVRDKLDQNFFRVRFDRLTPGQRRYLRAMAELGEGPHRSGEIAAALGVPVSTVGPVKAQLILKGMIYSPAHGDTAFTVPLFEDFLKRALPWP